jgi:hypothetical protein
MWSGFVGEMLLWSRVVRCRLVRLLRLLPVMLLSQLLGLVRRGLLRSGPLLPVRLLLCLVRRMLVPPVGLVRHLLVRRLLSVGLLRRLCLRDLGLQYLCLQRGLLTVLLGCRLLQDRLELVRHPLRLLRHLLLRLLLRWLLGDVRLRLLSAVLLRVRLLL